MAEERDKNNEALLATESAASNWTASDPLRPAGMLADGTRVGRYVVLEHIGSGGMGSVYGAYDPRLERKVAIKLLRADEGAGTDGTRRLLREAQALAKLAHPNIVAVYDADTHDGRVFIAMELVDGLSLSDWLRVKEREVDAIVDAFVDAGRGLAAAHDVELIHRDFKPANAVVGADGRVRVLDFGLARIDSPAVDAGASSGGAVALTRTGSVMGTPVYMAPEQHAGGPVTAAADQFAFCVSLYEAVYGEHPFGGDTVAELAARTAAGQLRPAPSGRAVPEWLRAALIRGMQPKVEDRHASMAALLDVLSRRGRKRRGGGVIIGGVLAAAVVGGFFLTRGGAAEVAEIDPCSAVPSMLDETWNASHRAAIRERAPGAEIGDALVSRLDVYAGQWLRDRGNVCAERDEAYVERVRCLDHARVRLESVGGILASAAPGIYDRPEPLLSTLPELASCSQEAGAMTWLRAPVDAAARAERTQIQERVGKVFSLRGAGRIGEAKKLASTLGAELPQLRDLRARSLAARSAALFEADSTKSEALFRAAIRDAIAVRDEHLVVNIYADLVGMLIEARRFDDIEREVEMAQAQNDRLALFVDTWPNMARWTPLFRGRLHNLRGIAARAQAKHEASKPHFEAAIEAWRAVARTHPDRLASALNNLGDAHRETGAYAKAIEYYDRALALVEGEKGTHVHTILVTLQNRGAANIAAGWGAAARKDYARALTVAGDRSIAGELSYNLAALSVAEEDLDAAQGYLDRAREIWTKHKANPLLFEVGKVVDSTIRRKRGDHAAAAALANEAHVGLAKALGPGHAYTAAALGEHALALSASGDHGAASKELEAALAIYAKTTGLDTIEAAATRAGLGRALMQRGPSAYEAADRELAAAVETFTRMQRPDHVGQLEPLLDRAELARAMGDASRAAELVNRALVVAAAKNQTPPPSQVARAERLHRELSAAP